MRIQKENAKFFVFAHAFYIKNKGTREYKGQKTNKIYQQFQLNPLSLQADET